MSKLYTNHNFIFILPCPAPCPLDIEARSAELKQSQRSHETLSRNLTVQCTLLFDRNGNIFGFFEFIRRTDGGILRQNAIYHPRQCCGDNGQFGWTCWQLYVLDNLKQTNTQSNCLTLKIISRKESGVKMSREL